MVPLNLKIQPDFYSEEIRSGYRVSIEMKQIWAVELDLLNELQRVCKKYNIRYFADGGTMLGAIRHHGFIPWDNDIDIVMFRNDYLKLCEIAPHEFKYPYFFQTEYTDPTSLRGHAQIRNSSTTGAIRSEVNSTAKFNQGIFIDVFPLDGVPDDDMEMQHHLEIIEKNLIKAKRIASVTDGVILNDSNQKALKKVIRLFGGRVIKKFVNYDKYYISYEKECMKYDPLFCKHVAKYFAIPFRKKLIWNSEDFSKCVEVPFEMLSLPVPCGYENILKTFFGESWRKPIQVDTSHGNMLFDVNKSYKHYIR